MGRDLGSVPTPVYRRVMIFIDGGYFRQNFEEIYKHQNINWAGLLQLLDRQLGYEGRRHPEVIRAYYYDAIVDAIKYPEDYEKQDEYFNQIREHGVYEVRLARIKKTIEEGTEEETKRQKKRQKQKGADVLLAVDMVTKALRDHYDIAILLTGDDDFLDLVKAVKDLTDKRVYGAFYSAHISEKLRASYDKKQPLTKHLLDRYKVGKKEKGG